MIYSILNLLKEVLAGGREIRKNETSFIKFSFVKLSMFLEHIEDTCIATASMFFRTSLISRRWAIIKDQSTYSSIFH